jgi:alcohol dehydrogenase
MSQLDRMHVNSIRFEDMELNSGIDQLHAILAKSRASRPHFIIAAGGMRTLSIGRLLASLSPATTSIERFLAGEIPIEKPLPQFNIAASARDPWCGSPFLLLGETFLGKPHFLPQAGSSVQASFFDPKLHQGLPQKQACMFLFDLLLLCADIMAASTINSISACNATESAITAAHALRTISSSGTGLKASMEACAAGALSTVAAAASGPSFGVALAMVLHARFRIPKSLVASILLPHILEMYGAFRGNQFQSLAEALGVDIDTSEPELAPQRAAQVLRRITAMLNLPARLQELKVGQDQIQESAALAMELPFIVNAPFPVHASHFVELLRKAV